MSKAVAAALALVALIVVAVAGAAVTVTQVSQAGTPFTSCTADHVQAQIDAFGSVNYPASEIEPRSAINPTNANNIIGVYQQDRWSDGGARGLVASVTHDGGTTWTRHVIPGVSACSGNPVFARATDPWVTFSPNGAAYAFSFSFDAFTAANAMYVSKSTDGGDTWGAPIAVIDERPKTDKKSFTGGNDKNAITADPGNSNYVYAVWDRFQSPPGEGAADVGRIRAHSYIQSVYFSRTTDGGQTWEPAREIWNPGVGSWTLFNQIVVTSSGVVLDGTGAFIDNPTPKFGFAIVFIRSTDKGATWSKKATTVAYLDLNDAGVVDPGTGVPVRSGGIDFAAGPNNRVYAVWSDDTPTPGIESILFSQSTDGGLTWSVPIVVNKTPRNIAGPSQQAFTPTVAVTSGGTVGVSYYDFRANGNVAGSQADLWLVRCSSSCASPASWAETHVAGPFDHSQAPVARGEFLGDYMGMTTSGANFQPFFIEGVSAGSNPTDALFASVTP